METQLTSANIYLDSNSLTDLKRQADQHSDAALRGVAQQFEALFLQQMLKTMRDAELSPGIFDSDQSKMYTEFYDKQLALTLSSNRGIGLAEKLYQDLKVSQAQPIPITGQS